MLLHLPSQNITSQGSTVILWSLNATPLWTRLVHPGELVTVQVPSCAIISNELPRFIVKGRFILSVTFIARKHPERIQLPPENWIPEIGFELPSAWMLSRSLESR